MSERPDLDALRSMAATTGIRDDGPLAMCLDAANAWVRQRIYSTSVGSADVTQATLILALRLYKRRQSPEGVAGWDEMGSVRIIARDPDIASLLEQHLNAAWVLGVA